MSKYAGIKAGALHEHTELGEYYCTRCGCPVTYHDSYCRECGAVFQWSFATEPCDRDALLALADDIDKQTDGSMFDIWLEDGHYIARRIREALGVEDGN